MPESCHIVDHMGGWCPVQCNKLGSKNGQYGLARHVSRSRGLPHELSEVVEGAASIFKHLTPLKMFANRVVEIDLTLYFFCSN